MLDDIKGFFMYFAEKDWLVHNSSSDGAMCRRIYPGQLGTVFLLHSNSM